MVSFSAQTGDQNPDLLKAPPGEHVWTVMAVYRVSANSLIGSDPVNMDRENLATVQTGCYACEQPYSYWVAQGLCPGPI